MNEIEKVKISVNKDTSAIEEVIINDIRLTKHLLGADFKLSLGHGAKLELGLILKRNEYEIINISG